MASTNELLLLAQTNFMQNRPFWQLQQTVTQSLIGSNSAITFDSSLYDTYNGHSNVTNNSRYTSQVAGVYFLNGAVCTAAASGYRVAQWRVNGSTILPFASVVVGNSSSSTIQQLSTRVYLNVGDYVELVAATSVNVNTSTSLGSCMFEGIWEHA